MSTVSVIIPVYQVEAYLERCVYSVLTQTLEDLEIILVDDGSLDECPQMCDRFAKADERVKVVHKVNGGLASARNAGLEVATGRYVFFLDSDDWIDSDTLSELVVLAEQYQVDFVRFRPMFAGWPDHADGDLCDFGTENCLSQGYYNRIRIEKEVFPHLIASPSLTLGAIVSACRSLYNREFLEINKLRFQEEIRYCEDSLFSAQLVYASNSFYYLDGARYYHYFFNPSSITKSFKSDRWEICKRLMRAIENEFSQRKDYDFSDQIALMKIYCIMVALGQRNLLKNYRDRKRYCYEIVSDPAAIDALHHINLVQGSWKLKILLLIAKFRQVWLLTRI